MKRLLLTNLSVIVMLLISQISFSEPTHMGVEPQELVSLILVCEIPEGGSTEICDFKRTNLHGPVEADFFVIPEGKVLVLTDFDWKYINTIASDLKDQLIEVRLTRGFALGCIANPALCPKTPVKSFGIAHQVGPTIGGAIFAYSNVQMTTGFGIAWTATVDVSVWDMFGNFLPVHSDFADLQATARGYLVAATCGTPGMPPCR